MSLAGGGAGIVVALVVTLVLVTRGSGSTVTPGLPTPTPHFLAPLSAAAMGTAIDGIQCETAERTVYHIHAHLSVYVDGAVRQIPEGVGIAPPRQETPSDAGPYVTGGKCFYWLHTHTDDGLIHIESPSPQTFTLGQFFDLWGQPLGAGEVAMAAGSVTAYVDGQLYTGDPRAIPLTAHTVIQLDVGTPITPKTFQFPAGY
jgi:hypothetical protein